jgi:hypothetical protein
MTEIKIEKKTPVWPWILLVLALVVAAWFLFFRNDKDDLVETTDPGEKALIASPENNNIVATYVSFINSDTNTMGIDHAFTSEALTKLTNAVDAKATEVGYDVKADISRAKQLADEITSDPNVITHADKIRSAADILSAALQNLQHSKFTGLSAEAADVKSAAAAIDPKKLTLDQRDAVKSFFSKAADLLNKMN